MRVAIIEDLTDPKGRHASAGDLPQLRHVRMPPPLRYMLLSPHTQSAGTTRILITSLSSV
eukprot:767669-Hanusia_phi.AAC.6